MIFLEKPSWFVVSFVGMAGPPAPGARVWSGECQGGQAKIGGLETRETLPGRPEPVTFSIPKELARRQADVDRLISEMATAIDEGRDAGRVADAYEMSDECRRSMETVAATMAELHAAGRNHVWACYIRNMIRPAVIAEEKVNRIIGNPPWLTYGQSADIIREELRGMSEQRYQIWAGGKLAPHQDIATLFYTRCAELRQGRRGHRHGHAPQRVAHRPAFEVAQRRIPAQGRPPGADQHRPGFPGRRPVGLGQRNSRLLPDAGQRGVRPLRRRGARRRPGAGNRAGLARQLAGRLRRHQPQNPRPCTTTTASSSPPTLIYPARGRP